MLKIKIFSIITVNALTSTKKTKILASLVLKKHYFVFVVNNCILMYLEIIILYIYNFLIPYWYLFRVIYLFILPPPQTRIWSRQRGGHGYPQAKGHKSSTQLYLWKQGGCWWRWRSLASFVGGSWGVSFIYLF